MLCDMVRDQEQLTILLLQTSKEQFSSPPSAQSFNIFPETYQDNSEVASSSNGGDEGYSSNQMSVSYILYNNTNNNNNINNKNTDDLSLVFDSPRYIGEGIDITSNNNNNEDRDNLSSLVLDSPGEIDIIPTSIGFNHSTNYTNPHFLNNQQQQQFDPSSLNNQNFHEAHDIITNNSQNHQYNNSLTCPPVIPIVTTSSLLTHSFEDESFGTVVPSCTQINPAIQSYDLPNSGLGTYISPALPIGNNSMNLAIPDLCLGYDFAPQDFNFQVDNNNLGNNLPNTISPVNFNRNNDDLKVYTNENQHLIEGHPSSTPLTSSEILLSQLDKSSSFKVEKLSVEERKEKINKYMRKRNQRNFSKKIKYACRKTLADSRPRVRGRFVKNDDLIEATSTAMITHEEYIYESSSRQMVLREEEGLVVSSDIFGPLNGVNLFSCNNSLYSIKPWI